MNISRLHLLFFLAGLAGLFITALLIVRLTTMPTNLATPEPSQDRNWCDLPAAPPLQLEGMRFQVNRQNFSVQAISLDSGAVVWESTGEDGFIVPGEAFPLAVSPEGNLWVANVGRKRLEQLDPQTGAFLASWQPVEQFGGCCNPVRFAALRHGRFVTMEKGTRQARLLDPAGRVIKVITGELSQSESDYQLIHLPECVYIIDHRHKRIWQVPDPPEE